MPFDRVADALLKGGIAPRHVRRYVRELDEHLDDLTAQQRASGYDGEDAALRARAQLGDDAELAQAMLDQPGMRSWPARLPWLVFLLLPPVVSAVIGLALYTVACLIGAAGLVTLSTAAMAAVQALAAPAMAALLVLLAERQRLKPAWPLSGIALLLLATPLYTAHFAQHTLQLGYGMVVPLRWSTAMRFWPVTLSHVLVLLPAVWLTLRNKVAHAV